MNDVPALSLREKISLVALKLIHDIESNPGPCSQVGVSDISTQVRIPFQGKCPGGKVLGVQSGCLFQGSGQDPLKRLLAGSTYTNGGSARYIHSLKLAIDAFIDREHPDVGETGLKVVPSLPNGQEGISLEELSLHCIKERLGGVISGEFHL